MSAGRNGRDDEQDVSGSAAATEDSTSETGLVASSPEPGEGEGAPRDELGELRREVAELRDALLRRRADFENYRKRVERDRATATVEAEAGVLRQLVGTVDNLERALAAQDAGQALRDGVVLTHRELVGLFDSLGVEVIDPLGKRFDPAEHQAIQAEPAPGYEPGTVAEVYRKGFRYRDRLLRPALVKVASEDAGPGPGGDVQ